MTKKEKAVELMKQSTASEKATKFASLKDLEAFG